MHLKKCSPFKYLCTEEEMTMLMLWLYGWKSQSGPTEISIRMNCHDFLYRHIVPLSINQEQKSTENLSNTLVYQQQLHSFTAAVAYLVLSATF